MANTVLKVFGMHCDSCKYLIRMAFEDSGLNSKVERIDIGEVELINPSAEAVSRAKEVINHTNNYRVIE